jgi:hypothetical protein
MKTLQTTILASALTLLACGASFAQNAQWQLQVITQPEPRPAPVQQYVQPINQVYPAAAPVPVPAPQVSQAVAIVESIQSQQDARIRWAAQRGYITDAEYRRLVQMQNNIEHNRRIAYADGYFNAAEQQFVYGQLNVLSAEIDTLLLNGNYVMPYFQQFNAPIPVWASNGGWVNGRYELRADSHHSRAYRPAPQPPVVQAPPQNNGHHNGQGRSLHRSDLRELLDPLGLFR